MPLVMLFGSATENHGQRINNVNSTDKIRTTAAPYKFWEVLYLPNPLAILLHDYIQESKERWYAEYL
jgi:hypothetical protein